MKKSLGVFVVLFLCLWPLAAFTMAPQTSQATASSHPNKYCVLKLAPLRAGQQTSDVLSSQCFSTFSASIVAATAGHTHLPANVKPWNLTQAMLDTYSMRNTPQSSYVLSIEYWDAYYQGSTWAIDGSYTCNQVQGYGMSYVGDVWNDQISSSRGYSNCNHVIHWENSNYWGSSYDCTCVAMGVMNDQTSSIQWHS